MMFIHHYTIFLLKLFYESISILGLSQNIIFISKIFSIIPYGLLLIISLTKIRQNYSIFVSGLLSFTLIAMSGFYIQYLTIRMYSWCLLFLIIEYLLFKNVLENSDKKSWVNFTIFAILGAYTHYFLLISSILLYLILFVHIYKNKNLNLQNVIYSLIAFVVSFIPWIFVLIPQIIQAKEDVNSVATSIDFIQVINYFSYHGVYDYSNSFEISWPELLP